MYCEINFIKGLALLFLTHFTCVSTSTLPINWTLATFTNLVFERRYTYPAYNEVAPSPCDLTQSFCDIYCCSDVDCSSEEKASFPCREPAKEATLEDLLSCDGRHDDFHRPGWFSLLCHVSSNTPLLGRFFDLRPSFGSLGAMKEVVSPLETFGFGRLQERPPSTAVEPGYKYGKPVKVFWRSPEVSDSGELRVPRKAVGRCGQGFPVRYLVNEDVVCVETITRERCEEGSTFGVLRYAVAWTTGVEDQQRFEADDDEDRLGLPFVSVDGVRTSPAETATEFFRFCNGSDYLTFSRSLSRDEEKRLPQRKDDYDYAASCDYGFEVDGPSLLTTFNESTGMCRNVAVSVEYRFVWKGPQLKKLGATYVLVDVPTSLIDRVDEEENQDEVGEGQDDGDEGLFVPMVDGGLTVFVTRTFSVNFNYERPNVTRGEEGGKTTALDSGDGNNSNTSATASPGEGSSVVPTATTSEDRRASDGGHFTIGSPTAEEEEEEKGSGNGTYSYQGKSAIYMWSGVVLD